MTRWDGHMSKRLAAMKNNPRADWQITDVEAVCREHGVACNPPTGGGKHYKVAHQTQREILTIPAARPIKPPYIKRLVGFLEDVAAKARK